MESHSRVPACCPLVLKPLSLRRNSTPFPGPILLQSKIKWKLKNCENLTVLTFFLLKFNCVRFSPLSLVKIKKEAQTEPLFLQVSVLIIFCLLTRSWTRTTYLCEEVIQQPLYQCYCSSLPQCAPFEKAAIKRNFS